MRIHFLLGLTASFVSAPALAEDLRDLKWLTGCYESTYKGPKGETKLEERWMAPTANSIIGMSRRVDGQDTRQVEFMEMAARDGRVTFMVLLGFAAEKPEPPLVMAKRGAAEIVFEDKKRAFPQRLIYAAPNAQALTARLEGVADDGKPKVLSFEMKRVKCE